MKRKIFALFLLVIICGELLPLLAQGETGIKQQFEQKISQLLGVPVAVADYKLEYTTVILRQVKIGDKNKPELPFGTIEKLSATCDFMSLLGGTLVLNDVTLKNLQIELTRSLKGSFLPDKLVKTASSSTPLSFADLPFLQLNGNSLQIKVTDKSSQRLVTTTIDSLKIERSKGSEQLTLEFSGQAETGPQKSKTDAGSKFSAKISMQGEIAKPSVQGTATISSLKVQNPILKQKVELDKGIFSISENSIKTQNLSGLWGHSKISISGQVNDFKDFNFSLNFKVNPIVLEEFSKAFVSESGLSFSGSGAASGQIKGSSKGFLLSGTLQWPSCKIEAPLSAGSKNKFIFPFKNVTGAYNFDGKKIVFSNASAEIFGGQLNGSGKVHSGSIPVKFEMNLRGSGLRTEQFLGENSTQKNVVSGPVAATLTASGNSSGLNSMNGNGSLVMSQGRYNAPPVVTPLLSMINLKEFSSGEIHSGQGSFQLRSGILFTDDLVFVTSAGKAYYRGQVGLDTSLKGKLNLMFAENAVNKSAALQQISMDGKSASVPSNVEGTLLSPSFPGFSAEKLLELGLKRTGQKILNDILSPRKKETEDNSGSDKKKDPGKQILNDLKKIFKFNR